MKRKLVRYSKYIVLFVILAFVIALLSRPRDKWTYPRNFSRRNGKTNVMQSSDMVSQPDLESPTARDVTLHVHKEVVHHVDEILRQWEPRFVRTERFEERNNAVTKLSTTTKSVVHVKTNRTVAVTTNTPKLNSNITNKNVENKTDQIQRMLRETAEHLTQDSIVKIRFNDPDMSDGVYVIRRAGKSVKITKTKPLYPSDRVNNYNISYIIPNKNACSGDPRVFVLTMVFNQHTEERYRRIVREYWGKSKVVKDKRIQHIFLLGRTTNKLLQRRTDQESRKFGDIVQGDFLDTYKNLTLKTLLGFQWIRDFCQEANFVLKVDSDIIVNYLSLIPHLVDSPQFGFVEGHVQSSLYPSRKKYSKWYTPEEDYPEPTYAPYAVGPSYLMSSDVSTKVLHTAQFVRFLPWEDAYVGLVLKRLNITNVNSKGYIVRLQGTNIWSKICQIQKYFTFYVGHELDEKRVRFIVDGWHQKLNFCD